MEINKVAMNTEHAVSYTHLDVYKRQLRISTVIRKKLSPKFCIKKFMLNCNEFACGFTRRHDVTRFR